MFVLQSSINFAIPLDSVRRMIVFVLDYGFSDTVFYVECNPQKAIRIVHKELNDDYHIMMLPNKILVLYSRKRIEFSYEQAGHTTKIFLYSFFMWLTIIKTKKEIFKLRVIHKGKDNYTTEKISVFTFFIILCTQSCF